MITPDPMSEKNSQAEKPLLDLPPVDPKVVELMKPKGAANDEDEPLTMDFFHMVKTDLAK